MYLEKNNMDQYKWIKQSFIRAFLLAAAITIIVGLIIGKVVEANIWLEIAKWAALAIIVGICSCVVLAPVIGALDPVRDRMFPKYGKKWWLEWIKNGFKSN